MGKKLYIFLILCVFVLMLAGSTQTTSLCQQWTSEEAADAIYNSGKMTNQQAVDFMKNMKVGGC